MTAQTTEGPGVLDQDPDDDQTAEAESGRGSGHFTKGGHRGGHFTKGGLPHHRGSASHTGTGTPTPESPAEEQPTEEQPTEEDPDTFPREYVQQLREENKQRRIAAETAEERADQLAQRLHTALVAATGRLADPDDLPYTEDHLDDPEALTAALDDLLARKPHLASRRPAGSIGQGEAGATTGVDLAGLLRSRA